MIKTTLQNRILVSVGFIGFIWIMSILINKYIMSYGCSIWIVVLGVIIILFTDWGDK